MFHWLSAGERKPENFKKRYLSKCDRELCFGKEERKLCCVFRTVMAQMRFCEKQKKK